MWRLLTHYKHNSGHRITEWEDSEWTSGDHLVQAPARLLVLHLSTARSSDTLSDRQCSTYPGQSCWSGDHQEVLSERFGEKQIPGEMNSTEKRGGKLNHLEVMKRGQMFAGNLCWNYGYWVGHDKRAQWSLCRNTTELLVNEKPLSLTDCSRRHMVKVQKSYKHQNYPA